MLPSAALRPRRPMWLWERLVAALTVRRTAAPSPGAGSRDVGSLSDASLRDLGLARDQIGGNISFAKGDDQRFL